MSQIFKIHHVVFILVLLSNMLFANIVTASIDNGCIGAMPVDLDGTYRGYDNDPSTTELFVIDVPAPGIVSIDISVPAAALIEPKLGSLGRHCAADSIDADIAVIERSLAHQTIAFLSAGRYFFRVAAQDPSLKLGEFAVRTSFADAQVEERFFDLGSAPGRGRTLARETQFFVGSGNSKTDQEEVDPNPKSAEPRHALSLIDLHATLQTKTDQEEVDPNPKSWAKTDQEEVDPNPKNADIGESARIVLFADAPGRLFGKTDQEEVDPNPKSADMARIFKGLVTVYRSVQAKTDQEEVDPNPKSWSKTDQEEVDPNPKAAALSISERVIVVSKKSTAKSPEAFLRWLDSLVWSQFAATPSADEHGFQLVSYASRAETAAPRFQLDRLCARDGVDDYGDTLSCAAPLTLGAQLSGEATSAWDGDVDVFTFKLLQSATVEIETAGSSDTLGALYDQRGHRLAQSDDGGSGDNLRLVKTLSAGQYFIRIETAGRSTGAFSLTVNELDW